MKLTKGEFKAMIKECIKELITEGAFDTVLAESMQKPVASGGQRKVLPAGKKSTPQPRSADPMFQQRVREAARRMVSESDDYRYGNFYGEAQGLVAEEAPVAPGLQRLVESTATSMAKGNPALANQYAAILADTAVNTLPKQMANDPSRSGYSGLAGLGAHAQVEKVQEQDLQNMAPMGDMSHWAALAFGGSSTGKR